MKKSKVYKIIVTTDLPDSEFDMHADDFLRKVSARLRMDLVVLLDEKELPDEYAIEKPHEIRFSKDNKLKREDL